MNECIVCGVSCQGVCCSGSCRAKRSRRNMQGKAHAHASKAHAHAQSGGARAERTVEANSDKLGQGMTMTPDGLVPDDKLPNNYGEPDCECMHCKSARINNSKRTRNHGAYKPASELKTGEGNRQSLPGDADYIGCCEQFGGAWMTKQAIEQAQSHELN